jgi:hypothetical protein
MVHTRKKLSELNRLWFRSKVATKAVSEDGMTKLYYHSTPVVEFDEKKIRLNTGGWHSNTTKARMNQASDVFDLGFRVFQKDYEWFVNHKGKTKPFEEGMELSR